MDEELSENGNDEDAEYPSQADESTIEIRETKPAKTLKQKCEVLGKILLTWILTIPITASISAICYAIVRALRT